MTNPSTVVSTSLADRISERAARHHAPAEVPLIVLDEMIAEGLHLQHDSRLESAKVLLVQAYRSASTGDEASPEEAVVA